MFIMLYKATLNNFEIVTWRKASWRLTCLIPESVAEFQVTELFSKDASECWSN